MFIMHAFIFEFMNFIQINFKTQKWVVNYLSQLLLKV